MLGSLLGEAIHHLRRPIEMNGHDETSRFIVLRAHFETLRQSRSIAAFSPSSTSLSTSGGKAPILLLSFARSRWSLGGIQLSSFSADQWRHEESRGRWVRASLRCESGDGHDDD